MQALGAIAWHWLLVAWVISTSRSLRIKQKKQSLHAGTSTWYQYLMPLPFMMNIISSRTVNQTKFSSLKLFLVRCSVTTQGYSNALLWSGCQWTELGATPLSHTELLAEETFNSPLFTQLPVLIHKYYFWSFKSRLNMLPWSLELASLYWYFNVLFAIYDVWGL